MWRNGACRLQTLATSLLKQPLCFHGRSDGLYRARTPLTSAFFHSRPCLSFAEKSDSEKSEKEVKTVEDIMPIATGYEREELEYELQGKKRFDLDPPRGPFGTKEAPAIVESYFDKRIVGCPGGLGDDEHEVIWFWLEKDKPFVCPICNQYFQLKVVGPGGPPGGHHD
eukprot:TRINITY_DN1104_c0_g2_i1.p1 TRINITY_DN1104_c0_g2~~TRINITY_DN1104_c0_g2_i1.p1  ORF type:complete len:168 (+),score=21.53 TRINITY_DN1104_c0_g2_i1:210-713(+)